MPTTKDSCFLLRLAARFRLLFCKVLCAFLALLLSFNLLISPRRYSYAIGPALPVLVSGLGMLGTGADVTFGGLLAAAFGGAFVSAAVQGNDFWNDVANTCFGTDAVPANQAFLEDAYAQYQETGSFGVAASAVPDSLVTSICDSLQSTLEAYNIPFTLDYLYNDKAFSDAVNAVNSYTGFTGAFAGAPVTPAYICWREVTSDGAAYYGFLYWRYASRADASSPHSLSFGLVNGKPTMRFVGPSTSVWNVGSTTVGSSSSTQPVYVKVVDGSVVSYGRNASSSTYAQSVTPNSNFKSYGSTGSTFTLFPVSSTGFALDFPVVSGAPAAITDVADGLADGTLTPETALPEIQTALGDSIIAVPMEVTSYGDVVLDNESGEGEGEGTGSYDGVLAQILQALGVSGPIASGIGSLLTAVMGLPMQLADLLFNAHVMSFSETALDSLDGVLSQYVASLPAWLQETGTVLDGLPSHIALALDGNFGDVITAVNNVLERVTGIPAEIPEAFGTIITGIPAQVWGEFDGPIGDIIVVLDGVLDGIMGIPRAITDAASSVVTGIGSLTLDVDLSAVLSAINAIPLSIAGALGLDWVITGSDELSERLEYPESSSFVLPTASWAQVASVAQEFGELTPLPYFEQCVNIVFDTFAGNGTSNAPRYVIVFPNPWGDDWEFVVDFALFDGRFVTVSHALFYVSFGIWYWGFLGRIKSKWDEVLQMASAHPSAA